VRQSIIIPLYHINSVFSYGIQIYRFI